MVLFLLKLSMHFVQHVSFMLFTSYKCFLKKHSQSNLELQVQDLAQRKTGAARLRTTKLLNKR